MKDNIKKKASVASAGETLEDTLGEGNLMSPRVSVGNQIITSRGYAGGVEMDELIGAKKMNGPKGS